MLTINQYVRPTSLEEAYQLNQKKNHVLLGGMLWLKMQTRRVDTAIDLCNLGLDTITETEDSFQVGAMVTLRQLETHPGLNVHTQGAIADSVRSIVGVQFRNCATVGGSIFSRYGFSDVLTMFLALDCCVEMYRGGIVPLEQFVSMPRDRDILVRVIVKKTPVRAVYLSQRNTATDFPVLTCAVTQWGGTYRVAVGARPAKAMLLRHEDSQGCGMSEDEICAFADFAAQTVLTGNNLRATATYRTHLIRVLVRRGLMAL